MLATRVLVADVSSAFRRYALKLGTATIISTAAIAKVIMSSSRVNPDEFFRDVITASIAKVSVLHRLLAACMPLCRLW